MQINSEAETNFEKATFAGGCFWCMEPPFEKLEGVIKVAAGYTGGHKENPAYEEVFSGITGHFEAIQITYDPSKITYPKLLEVFWQQIDPTDADGQFADRGPQYRAAIFYHNEQQKQPAEESKQQLGKSGKYEKPIVTEIIAASKFYKAEEYHQDYYKKSPVKYKHYKSNSGREQYLQKIWGKKTSKAYQKNNYRGFKKPDKEELKKKLTPLRYNITQDNGTEKPFQNEYWDNKRDGIYVDIISGEPLFCSLHKFDSGTGWPSFTRPLESENIVQREDKGLFMLRTEVRSNHADSHLGHVFKDGPPPTGLRYCINSAALKFIPKEDLEKMGYGEYKKFFSEK